MLTLRGWLLLVLVLCVLPTLLAAGYLGATGRKLPIVRTADLGNEARQRRIHESYLQLIRRTEQRVTPLLFRATSPTRNELSAALARIPSVARLEWTASEGTIHVITSRPGSAPVGTPLVVHAPPDIDGDPSVTVAATFDLGALRKALLEALPPEDGVICGFVDPEGLVLAQHPLEGSFGQLPALKPGRHENLLRQRGPLTWDKLRISWLKELRIALLVQRPVLTSRASREAVLITGGFLGCGLLLGGILALLITRPVRRLAHRVVEATEQLFPALDWHGVDTSDELAVIEASFATVLRQASSARDGAPPTGTSPTLAEEDPARAGDEGGPSTPPTAAPEAVATSQQR